MTEGELDGRLEKGGQCGWGQPARRTLLAGNIAGPRSTAALRVHRQLSLIICLLHSIRYLSLSSPLLSLPLCPRPARPRIMFIRWKNRFNKTPAIAAPVTSLGHGSHGAVPLAGVQNDVQKRIERAESFICSSAHRMKKFSVLLLHLRSTPPSHSLLLHLLCGGFGES